MDRNTQLKMIDQAFLPAREIETPDLFSGRKGEITKVSTPCDLKAQVFVYMGNGVSVNLQSQSN